MFFLSDDEVRSLGEGELIVRDGVLGEELARRVRAEATSRLGDLEPAGIGRGSERREAPAIRGDDHVWLDPPALCSALSSVWSLFSTALDVLNQRAWLGVARFEVQLAAFRRPGARYTRHLDAFRDHGLRRATLIYYLNPGWCREDGGELRVYLGDRVCDIEPLLDRLVLFLSDRVEHEVLPARRLRLAITAWFRRSSALPFDVPPDSSGPAPSSPVAA